MVVLRIAYPAITMTLACMLRWEIIGGEEGKIREPIAQVREPLGSRSNAGNSMLHIERGGLQM